MRRKVDNIDIQNMAIGIKWNTNKGCWEAIQFFDSSAMRFFASGTLEEIMSEIEKSKSRIIDSILEGRAR